MYELQRQQMVKDQIKARNVSCPAVIHAMEKVERHLFVSREDVSDAYGDYPLQIGADQTISQPFIVAHMTELLELNPLHRVLEIGTGSGYQTAILAECCAEVYSIELIELLAKSARSKLTEMGYRNIHFKCGDGYLGWPEHAPFDAIIVTAAPPELPTALLEQLNPGARLVIPVGGTEQRLKVITRGPQGVNVKDLYPVRFVPMLHL